VALDYDGTLAPIVHPPPDAQMTASTARELDRLCSLASVAIVSGRELNDLERRVSAKASFVIGNHGNEGLAAIHVDGGACRDICADWMRQLRRLPHLDAGGVHIEPKGYTISVHFRLARDHVTTRKILSAAFAFLTPMPRVVGGKCVFNLIPPGAVCKDDAMEALVDQLQPGTVIYVGDDECDELVFARARPDWITVRVGYWRHSTAKYYLRYQREVRDLLSLLNLQLQLAAPEGN
jgi:trehalose 6-phosphate phosphatase